MTRPDRDSRYLYTMDVRQEGFRWRESCGIGRGQVDDQADGCLAGVLAPANAEASNFDQARQLRCWPDHQLTAAGFEVDPIVANQDRRRDLPGTPGQDEIEGEP